MLNITIFSYLQKANQTGNSNAMELAGAKSCFKYLQNLGIKVSTFVSDRHKGIAKWIRESQPDTRHFNDLWHVVKGITKKLIKAGKEKGNEKLLVWVKAIRTHLYWCALSTKQGFGDLIIAKWKSVIRHIANLHTNHPDSLYANCPYGPLEPRDWIKLGDHVTVDNNSLFCRSSFDDSNSVRYLALSGRRLQSKYGRVVVLLREL